MNSRDTRPRFEAGPTAAAPDLGRGSIFATIAAVWGPGLLVMLADTDAGNIVAAAESGSRWGYRLAPLLLLLTPVLILVQDLALRIGLFRGRGFGELIRERFGRAGALVAAGALVVATLGSLVTELTGIAGVGELYGASRWIIVSLAAIALILVALTGQYRRVERIALIFGLFELSFLVVAWRSQPSASAIFSDIADQKLQDFGFLYLGAGLIGATFNPWMIFYQASAIAEKRLAISDYRAARWDTIIGAILTQLVTVSVLAAIAALNRRGTGAPLDNIGRISEALTPFLGDATGRLVFSAGVVGAAMAAAIVSSLACAWGLSEIFAPRRAIEREARNRFSVLLIYSAWIAGSAALVLWAPDLVRLSIDMQVLNAILLPIVATLLVVVAATLLPEPARLGGWRLWVTAGLVGVVSLAGLIGAAAGLQ